MHESESSVHNCAEFGDGVPKRICADLLGDRVRFTTWFSFHGGRMSLVTAAKRREPQILALRLVATQQVHRAALIRHIRDNKVRGRERDFLLREFHGPLDTECAILAEHRVFAQAVSSQLCAADLLELSYDRFGAALIETYERQYGIFFAMHCDRLRARAEGRHYLLSSLLPEVRDNAKRLRSRLLSGERLPARRVLLPALPQSYQ